MDKPKIKVMFVIPSLRAGGAERVMSFISDNLNRTKFETSLVIIESGKERAYELDNIEPIFLNKRRSRDAIFSLLFLMLKKKPDVVVSSIGQINLMLSIYAIFLRKIKFITRETYVRGTSFKNRKSKFLGFFDKIQKVTIDKVICQSVDIYRNLIENYGFNKEQLVIINNPITTDFQSKKIRKKADEYNLITIGRLEKQKGYERILRALSKLEIPFKYTIIGSGSLEDEILKIARNLNLDKNIVHIRYTKNIYEHLVHSDIYLQGSYYEGFPNALLESCSVGTPVLAFNAPGGINEIIQNGINGYRVDTQEEFIDKLNILIQDIPDPSEISKSVSGRYSREKILAKYEQLFNDIVIQ